MTPYRPSPATKRAGFSFYRETTIGGLVSSRQFRDKGPLRIVYLSLALPRLRTTHEKVNLVLLSIRCMYIELCCHLFIQLDTVPFHTQAVDLCVPFFESLMLDRISQGQVKTKSGSSYNCQFTPTVILQSGVSYGL